MRSVPRAVATGARPCYIGRLKDWNPAATALGTDLISPKTKCFSHARSERTRRPRSQQLLATGQLSYRLQRVNLFTFLVRPQTYDARKAQRIPAFVPVR